MRKYNQKTHHGTGKYFLVVRIFFSDFDAVERVREDAEGVVACKMEEAV